MKYHSDFSSLTITLDHYERLLLRDCILENYIDKGCSSDTEDVLLSFCKVLDLKYNLSDI